jgi:hypothetical protein
MGGGVKWGLLTRVWRRRQFVWCMTLMIYADLGLAHGSLASFKKGSNLLGRGLWEMKSKIGRILPAGIGTACSFRTVPPRDWPSDANLNDIIHTKKFEGAMVAHLARRFSADHKATTPPADEKGTKSLELSFSNTDIRRPSPKSINLTTSFVRSLVSKEVFSMSK